MRRKRLLLAAVASLGALSGLGVGLYLAATSPLVRARTHLRLARPNEVQFFAGGASALTGHARAFVESPRARDLLLPDLVELALAEADRDDGVCYRELVFEATTGPAPRPASTIEWGKTPPPAAPGAPLPGEVLRAMAACLRSKDRRIRVWAVEHLPLDARLVEAVGRDAGAPDGFSVDRWLGEFGLEHQDLVRAGDGGGPDPAWVGCGSAAFTVLDEITLMSPIFRWPLIETWLARERSKLPEQIR